MTCKDCIHYRACKSLLEAIGFTVDGDGNDADKRCDEFDDRSEWEKQKRGEWIPAGEYEQFGGEVYPIWRCSVCGHEYAGDKMKRCSICDTKMEVDHENV